MLTIIDSDSPCYAAALSVQEINEETGEAQVQENGEKFLRSNLRNSIETILTDTFATDYKLFLTGEGNFRETGDNLYKANRTGMGKPILLQEARQFLVDEYNAIIVNGQEADDAVCIEQTYCMENDIECCIAHLDKDIDQQAGQHYRWAYRGKPCVHYYITEEEANRNLYVQALVGDRVDNIMMFFNEASGTWQKCYGLGDKGAVKYLSVHHTAKDMYQAVLDYYTTHPKFLKKDTGVQCTEEDLVMNMKMLYLLRHENEHWSKPE